MDAADARYYADLEAQFVRDQVPEVVRDSIRQYVAPDGLVIARKSKSNSSLAFSWGVRLANPNNPTQFWWICRASDDCRRRDSRINMMKGKTSKVAEHLRTVHNILSHKTETTENNKRRRDDLAAEYQASELYRRNPARFVVLLETLNVVHNNLPFVSVEKEESIMLRRLCYKEAHQATLNAKIIVHSILELYVTCKAAVLNRINAARGQYGAFFSLVTDFWTSEVQKKKYIGVRLYLVDASYTFQSFLLGTRQFDPPFGDRDRSCSSCLRANIDPCPHSKHKMRYPFRRWISNVLRDFNITRADLFGSTTDAGGDVKWMMRQGFRLRWEWCLAHLSNAATKSACGLVDDPAKSRNKAMTKLHKKITLTVFQTNHVEVMGKLFDELCGVLSEDNSKQLLNYRAHRFIGLTRVVERILLKWDVLVAWYGARAAKATRENLEPPEFPLDGHKRDLTQLLSLLQPISANNSLAQSEAPVQVDVLLGLFKLRLRTVNPDCPLRDWRSLSAPSLPDYFQVAELTPTIKLTRQLLCDAFHVRYFRRYTDRKEIERCSYVFEMQLALHPDFKDLDQSLKPVVILSNQQYGQVDGDHERLYNTVVKTIYSKILAEMKMYAGPTPTETSPPQQQEQPTQPNRRVDNENLEMFGHRRVHLQSPARVDNTNELLAELRRWRSDDTQLEVTGTDTVESVTTYWGRQARMQNPRYTVLPILARALFAVPSTSGQLERDFGMSGRQVTPERGRTGGANVDMSAFLNCNREFYDFTKCSAIDPNDRAEHLPSSVPVGGDPFEEHDDNYRLTALPPQVYSNTSLYEGEGGNESDEVSDSEYDDYE